MTRKLSHKNSSNLKKFYYGTPYYPEHWDAETREKDAERMENADFNAVRMAEFAWDVMEPREGEFDFALFDETIAKLGEKDIETILCTPTATPPRWLTFAHPDVLRVNADGVAMQHGSRQHACPSSSVFREYSRKITQAMADHYAENPHVVGWQTDNELNCHFSECHCENCQVEFRAFLREKFDDDISALNAAWGTAFWAQTYNSFDQIQTPRNGKPAYANPAHLLDYYRFISWNVTRFQREQVEILRAANPGWFVMHNGIFSHIDYRGAFTQDLDVLGYDVYPFFDRDPEHRRTNQAFNLDHARAWSGNFMIPEQQSGPGGQGAYFHDNPEPDEIRAMAYLSVSRGADSVMFFRWRTCRFGAEEYWCGVLDHDNVPRCRYKEFQQIGAEFQILGPKLLGTHVRVDVGIAAADVDVYDAHDTLSMGLPSPKDVAEMAHEYFFERGYAVGCVHPSDDLSSLKAYIIPHWAVFNPAWVPNLESFVENGGILVIGARTATKDWNNNVIAETPPGVLKKLAGVKIREYGRQNAPDKRPLTISFPKYKVATDHWYEELEILPRTAIIGRWEGRHLNRHAAVTMRKVGKGAVIYAGTYLSEGLLSMFTAIFEEMGGLEPLWEPAADAEVYVAVRENDEKRLWFFINNNERVVSVRSVPKGRNALSGSPISRLFMSPNSVSVIEETIPVPEASDSPGGTTPQHENAVNGLNGF